MRLNILFYFGIACTVVILNLVSGDQAILQ